MQTIKLKDRGFSLIELSVVMVIIGILIYMTLVAGKQQLQIARIKATQYKLQKIQTALTMYYKTYGHLPCPADGALAKTDPLFASQKTYYTNPASTFSDDVCSYGGNSLLTDALPNVYIGIAPVRDLGMSDDSVQDAWGNRITYVVSRNCVDPDNWSATNAFKCADSTINTTGVQPYTILSTVNGGKVAITGKNTRIWPDQAAYILISHGYNGYGAWSDTGAKLLASDHPVSGSEYNNGNLGTTGSHTPNSGSNGNQNYFDLPLNDGDANSYGYYFDNIVAWSTAPQIYYSASH